MVSPVSALSRAASAGIERPRPATYGGGVPSTGGAPSVSLPPWLLPSSPAPYVDPSADINARNGAEAQAQTDAAARAAQAGVSRLEEERLAREAAQREDEARVQAAARANAAQQAAAHPLATLQPIQNETHTLQADDNAFARGEARSDDALTLDAIAAAMQRFFGGGTPSGSSASVSAASSASGSASPVPPHVTPIAPPDTSAANSAAFSRAKDTVGQIGRAGLNSLRRAMGGRGLAGSSIEGRGLTTLVGDSMGQLSDVARQQAITDSQRAAEVADRNYAGELEQRNADIGVRGQNISADQAATASARADRDSRLSQITGLASLIRAGRRAY